MRSVISVVGLLIALSLLSVSQACAQAEKQADISFSLSFLVGQHGSKDIAVRHCLADAFKPGRKVVLLNKSEMCTAKTGSTFMYEEYGFEATRLIGKRKFLDAQPGETYWRFKVAIVGIDSDQVRLISPRIEQPALPKDVESKLIEFRAQQRHESNESAEDSTSVPFKALRVGKGVLVVLGHERGPIAWLFENKVAALEGDYTSEYLFFSIQKRLYIAYTGSPCRDCGQPCYYIYDLSGQQPKKVYENGKLFT